MPPFLGGALLGTCMPASKPLASVFPTEEDVDDAILEGVRESLEYAAGSI